MSKICLLSAKRAALRDLPQEWGRFESGLSSGEIQERFRARAALLYLCADTAARLAKLVRTQMSSFTMILQSKLTWEICSFVTEGTQLMPINFTMNYRTGPLV